MKKMNLKGIILLSVLLVSALFIFGCTTISDEPIGGDKDDYGCLVGAGYSFDENVGACTRSWELNESQKAGAKIAVDFVGFEKGLTVIEVIVYRCPACYLVTLSDSEQKQKLIQISNGVPSYNKDGLTGKEEFSVYYDATQGQLFYSMTLFTPNECEQFSAPEEVMLESYPVQVIVNLSKVYLDLAGCSNEEQRFDYNGVINIDHLPGSFTIKINGGTIFIENEIVQMINDRNDLPQYCTDEQRSADVCYNLYAPVCADVQVECVTTPCDPIKETFPNDCVACQEPNVISYVHGEC